MKTMAEVLDEHHDWAWSLEQGEVLCVGCDWSKKLRDIDPAAVAFRAHQADALTAAGYGPVKAAGAQALRGAAAKGWDAAVSSLAYPDGMPVEVAENINPFRATP